MDDVHRMGSVYVVPVVDAEGPSNCLSKGKLKGYDN
jgi:hypothetical protein